MSFCAHSVASRAAAVVDQMTAPDVTTSRGRNDRADRHERVDISEEIQYARVWAAPLQKHVVPSSVGPVATEQDRKALCSRCPPHKSVSILRLYDAHCRRGFQITWSRTPHWCGRR